LDRRGEGEAVTAFTIERITPANLHLWDAMLDVFGDAFEEPDTYGGARPPHAYRRALASDDTFIALVALCDGAAIGALAGYELRKFEQARSEYYIYDLAVAAAHRRRGVATQLIQALQDDVAARGGGVVFVQADRDDAPAVALYAKLGPPQQVLHFDIAPALTQKPRP
jgi:aminoglycoside 3-N-acetyltransferase I